MRATVDLGLSRAEYNRVTLRMLYALLDRYEAAQRRADLRAGLLASAVYNASPNRKRSAKALRPSDFFPGS